MWRYGEFKRSGENHGGMKHGVGNSSLVISRAIDVRVVRVLGEVEVIKMDEGDHREGRM